VLLARLSEESCTNPARKRTLRESSSGQECRQSAEYTTFQKKSCPRYVNSLESPYGRSMRGRMAWGFAIERGLTLVQSKSNDIWCVDCRQSEKFGYP
jgi:hypothetical protein